MLKSDATDEEIIVFMDGWVLLLEKEDYFAAFNFTKHNSSMGWTVELIKDVIKSYGESESTQKVTLKNNGLSIDGVGNIIPSTQRKSVTWYNNKIGDIWYDLNINGYISDLTATFDLVKTDSEIIVFLNDIHVM